jgi:hypothetical protein
MTLPTLLTEMDEEVDKVMDRYHEFEEQHPEMWNMTEIKSFLHSQIKKALDLQAKAVMEAMPEKDETCSQDNKPGMHYECDCAEKDSWNACRQSAITALSRFKGEGK